MYRRWISAWLLPTTTSTTRLSVRTCCSLCSSVYIDNFLWAICLISFHWSWLIDISFFPLYRVVQRVSECQNQTTRLDRDHLICLWVRETSHQASRGCHLKTGEQGLDRTLLPVAGEIDSWELQWFGEKQVVFYLFTWLSSVLFFSLILLEQIWRKVVS